MNNILWLLCGIILSCFGILLYLAGESKGISKGYKIMVQFNHESNEMFQVLRSEGVNISPEQEKRITERFTNYYKKRLGFMGEDAGE